MICSSSSLQLGLAAQPHPALIPVLETYLAEGLIDFISWPVDQIWQEPDRDIPFTPLLGRLAAQKNSPLQAKVLACSMQTSATGIATGLNNGSALLTSERMCRSPKN